MSWTIANGKESFTNRMKFMPSLFFCITVTATTVEAEPMGVRLPPRLAPKITLHQRVESEGVVLMSRILERTAARGMLSVTELAMAEHQRSPAPPTVSPRSQRELRPVVEAQDVPGPQRQKPTRHRATGGYF